MLDKFDRTLLDEVQRDCDRTADQLALRVALSPSAIARRLRRLRADGWIDRTIALLSARIIERRLRAVVLLQLAEHANRLAKDGLIARLRAADEVQWVYEITGTHDVLLMLDCSGMDEFVDRAETLLAANSTVRRYESFFVKRELKFAPFVRLGS